MLKWKKLAHSVSPAHKIWLDFPSIKIFRVFLPKGGEDLLSLFHKMLESLFVGASSVWAIVGAVLAAIMLIFLIFSVVVIWRCRRAQQKGLSPSASCSTEQSVTYEFSILKH